MDRRSTRHRLTRLGIQVMLIGIFGILGGSLNGLNLLVVVASITLGSIIVQWRLSRAMIDSLRIDRRMPAEAFAGKLMRIRYQINNEHRLMPLWLIRLEDTLQRTHDHDGNTTAVGTTATKPSRHQQRTFTGIGLLMPGQTTSAYFDIAAAHRGRYRFDRWLVSTNAPLALSTAYRESLCEHDFIDVYPRLLRLQRSWQRLLPSRIGNVSATVHRQGPSEDVFFGLREYRHGDSPRHIHWRTTARLGAPAVRQFEQQRRFDLCILVDACLTPQHAARRHRHRDSASSTWRGRWNRMRVNASNNSQGFAEDDEMPIDDTVETAISLAATIAIELTHGSQSRVLLVVAGEQIEVVASGSSAVGRKRMLQSLARVIPSGQVAVGEALLAASAAAARLPDLVVISSRSQARAAAADAAIANALRRWKARSQVSWVNVSEKDRDQWIVKESE
jgi:uncharacterized protein (DUF58 family)